VAEADLVAAVAEAAVVAAESAVAAGFPARVAAPSPVERP